MTPQQRPLGRTGLRIAPLVLGTNVFGWTVDEPTSFSVLDAFVDAGFDAIDTADSYSTWVPGHEGGESEAIIGRWLKRDPSKRARVHLFTKVGSDMGGPERQGLSKRWIQEAVEDSLRRLQVDTIDLYQSHWPDPDTPYEETLAAYADLIEAGKIRAIGASNLDAQQLEAALRVADAHGLPRYQTLQPKYNLFDRDSYEGPLRDLAIREGLGVITYYGLASGFLTGKYRSRNDLSKSARGGGVAKYLNDRGFRILAALDEVAGRHSAQPAEVALAWLMQREGVTAPIASATSREQLASLLHAAELGLSPEDVATLDAASA
jgi:aryl-alcohol dehydrogenase-like predicted oxidoreductase